MKFSPKEKRALQDSSILVILMGALGDVVRGLAVIDQIRNNFPHVKITWLIEPKCRGIVSLHSGIDKVILFERGQGLSAVLRLARTLRRERFDITLDMQRHLKSGFFSWLSGSARRIGFSRKNTKEGNFLFNNEYIPYREENSPKIEHYLDFVRTLGGGVQEPLTFGLEGTPLSDSINSRVGALRSHYVFLVMGSSWSSKNWPLDGYEGLLLLLLKKSQLGIVLVGDRTQRESQSHLLENLKNLHPEFAHRVVGVVGDTTLGELVTLISQSKGGAGPDSGPGHIAGAVGVPYVALFGPTPHVRVAPYGCEHLVVTSSLGCSPCLRRECPGLNTVCMRLLRPEVVFDRLFSALKEG